MNHIKKLALTGVLTALAVAMSPMSIPIGAARCFPVQHMVNIIAGSLLGPWYAVAAAFVTSAARNAMGTGTLLAFPGSMIGALLAGLAAKYSDKLLPVCAGELVGTGVLGALAAYPVAALILGREAALFTFVVPFTISSAAGAVIAYVLLTVLKRAGVLNNKLFS